MMKRRKLLIALGAGALAASLASFAQQQQKVYRVGILGTGTAASFSSYYEAFSQGLGELGYVEGKNISIERRFADGNPDRLPALAAELVQQKVDVIFASNTSSVQAARQVTGTIPIVFAVVGNPIGAGFVASLARPGGNITGASGIQWELSAKRLQILKEAFPNVSRVAVVVSSEPVVATQFAEVQRAAKILGMEVMSIEVRRRDDFEQGFTLLRKWRADSIYVAESPTNAFNSKLLAEFAAKIRLPAAYASKQYVEAGGLMSYGANYEALYRRAATYVDKILKGAKPADLPVELPTKFELVINMKTAKALGIKIPDAIRLRADEVIE